MQVRAALREMAQQLGVEEQLPELFKALQQMHRHQPGLGSTHSTRNPATSPTNQAAAVMRTCLEGQRVAHPQRHTFHRVGASAPALSVDHAVNLLLASA